MGGGVKNDNGPFKLTRNAENCEILLFGFKAAEQDPVLSFW